MFKGIKSALQSCFTKEFVLVVLIFGVLAWGLLSYSDQKVTYLDAMQDGSGDKQEVDLVKDKVVSKEVSPSAAPDAGYALKEVANPTDLLPQDKNSQWSELNPSSMTNVEGLTGLAAKHIGMESSSLRNANLQLRSDPIVPKADVGPWNQSTIEPDSRVELELGSRQ